MQLYLDTQSTLQSSSLHMDAGRYEEVKTNLAAAKTTKNDEQKQMEFRSATSQEVYDYSKMKEDSFEYIMAGEDTSTCRNPCSTWRSVSLIIMMVCFIAATPLSLILTLPAYILADKADVYAQHGHKELSRPLCIISVVLNMLAIWSVVVCVGIALFAYIYTQE